MSHPQSVKLALSPPYERLPPVSKARISARIAAIAESATLAVDAKAKALKAAGRPVIGFGAGEPDFPTPDYIVESAVAAAKVVAHHRYSPTPGLPELRQAIVDKTITKLPQIKFLLPMVASKLCTKHSQPSSIKMMK